MNIEELREYCLSFPHTTESFPFDATTLVIKVAGKMFALFDIEDRPLCVNLKCDPDLAIELRERYPYVHPGYHMHKRLWNTVELDTGLADDLAKTWIAHSYAEVVKGLPKKVRISLAQNSVI